MLTYRSSAYQAGSLHHDGALDAGGLSLII